jgi:hypothetical protein
LWFGALAGGYEGTRVPAAVDFPILPGISGLRVRVLDPSRLHDTKRRNLIKPLNYPMPDRIRHWVRVMALDPVVLPVLADRPLGGAESLTVASQI